MKQKIIAKYGKKFASAKSGDRSALEGIHYACDSTVFVTNSHYALRIKNVHSFKEPVTLHAKTGQPIDGVYPDLSRVFPDRFDNEIILKNGWLDKVILRTRCAADVASRLDKKCPIVWMEASNGSAYLQIKDEVTQIDFSAFFGNTIEPKPSKRSLNAEYLHTALSVFADAGSREIFVKLAGPLHPIVLTDGQDIDVLILPYRSPE